ncbi:MAG: M23 family metallopeptidase [Flavobacteriales bacterium]
MQISNYLVSAVKIGFLWRKLGSGAHQTAVTRHLFSLIFKYTLTFFFLYSAFTMLAQKQYAQDYFRSPLDIPLNLSGNFGELRTNHFHAGLDIKTQQQEGLKIYAVADGYVSRIKVSPFGYGYALYITHPNGYTTVYGHCQRYAEKIDDYVKQQQYKLKSFSVDLFPDSIVLPVTQGEVIALSGNSGGSGGPHLHFEVRETVTEKVVNPMLFGFDIKDKIKPAVNGIWIMPMNDSAWVNGAQLPVSMLTKAGSGTCTLQSKTSPTVYGDIAFAIHTSDALDGNSNRCGIYRIELRVDSLQVFGQRLDKLDFTTNRAMNAHTIYERFKKNRSSIHGSYRLPGNPLDIYDNLVNDGVLSFRDGKLHKCEYIVTDFEGNVSTLKFSVHAQKAAGKPKPLVAPLANWNWEKDNYYENSEVKISMKAFTLYEDLDLNISKSKTIQNTIGPTYLMASNYEPVHNSYTLCLNASGVKPSYESKAVVVRYDPDKTKISAELSKYENGWLCANPSYLGYFSIMIDTIKPTVAATDFAANMKGRAQFSMRISDGLSGVDQIIPTIDGQWVLMEYDAKTNRLTYYFDTERLAHGKHTFRLEVIDAVGNATVYNGSFDW